MSIYSVTFLSEAEALKLTPQPNAALISITEPNREAELPLSQNWGALLRIRFSDAEYDQETYRLLAERGQLFDPLLKGFPVKAHSLEIHRFLHHIAENSDIQAIIVHCKAGQRRSAAVAKFAAEQFGVDFDHDYAGYNRTVYALLQDPDCLEPALQTAARHERWWRRLCARFKISL